MKNLHYLMMLIDCPNQNRCLVLLENNLKLFKLAYGSSHNHQAWVGGYLDHITETMNVAALLYPTLSVVRPLPFSLSDALLIMFLHDLEKPWRFDSNGKQTNLISKKDKHDFRCKKLIEYGIELTPYQFNAFTYVEGEGDDYSSQQRIMNELAAFCHICDVASARIWHDRPFKNEKGFGY